MAGIGKSKFSELIPGGGDPARGHGKREDAPETVAEQAREAREAERARDAAPTRRERMVDIGRGNQQAGRQGD